METKANIDLSNILANIDYIVESYDDGADFYRIYKSGWIEQGGRAVVTNKSKILTLKKPYKTNKYYVYINATWSSEATGHNEGINIVSESQVKLSNDFDGECVCFWEAKGQGA